VSDALIRDTLPFYLGQLSDTEHVEPVAALRGETDGTTPAGLGADVPDLPASPPPSGNEWLAPGERLPASLEPWPQADQFPLFKSSDLSGTEPSNRTDPMSLFSPKSSTGNDPDTAGTRRVPQRLPAATDQQTTPVSYSIIKPLSVIRDLPDVPQSPAFSARQIAPMKRISPKSENALFEREQASRVQPEPLSGVEDLRSAVPAGGQPRWTIIAGILLLVAGGLFLVRRRKRSIARLHQQLLQPENRSRSSHGPHLIPPPPSRWNTKLSEQMARTQNRISLRGRVAVMVMLAGCVMTGCSSLTNPVQNGIPVRKLPTDLLSQPHRENLQTVPLSLLRQKQPENYILAAGDVVGVFIAGVFPLTLADGALTAPPVYFPSQIDPLGAGLPPSLGYPVTIRNDGTLALPMVEPISLDGLTVEEANERVRSAYIDKGILQPGRESVMLTLMQPRQIRVLVFRQEIGGFSAGGRGDISSNNVKQGTGHIVNLRAYENDVVNALANTGGLPGLDAFDGIFIFRGGQSNLELTQQLQSLPSSEELSVLSELDVKVDYIPTRWPPGEPLPFEPEDAILHEGDVVLLEARVEDLYYTAGLLPAGERVLPRDYDLDVVEAVVKASGTMVNGAFGGNNFNGLLIQKGIGNPNPSALTVIRRTPNGGQIPISVDLNRALIDPRERILIQPGDVLILQETKFEAMARYFNDIFNFNVQVFRSGSTSTTAVAPAN
jgi:LPXTG-motif cell wall-anchored protein